MALTVKKIAEIEQSISKMIEEIKSEIIEEIRTQVNEDYKPINSFCGVVRFSSLAKSNSWSPYYFSSEKQAELVKSALNSVQTVSVLEKKLKDFIETKKVKIKFNTEQLNPYTIKVLKKYYNGFEE